MKKWENFERDISDYVNDLLRNYDITVRKLGSSDSTIPDIEIVLNKSNKKFFIETKMPLSQTSQFVVEIKNGQFIYGSKNKFKSNKFSEEIIELLNNDFDFYKNVTQTGMVVPVPETIAVGWIASNMENKNVKFIISIDSSNNKKIIPLNEFDAFFNIKTILRRKKSGSQSIPKRFYDDFKRQIENRFTKYKIFSENNKLFISIPVDLSKKECYIESNLLDDGKKYFLSKKDKNIYEVKLTSATNNPTVIFELSPNTTSDNDVFTIQRLIEYILSEQKNDDE